MARYSNIGGTSIWKDVTKQDMERRRYNNYNVCVVVPEEIATYTTDCGKNVQISRGVNLIYTLI